MRASPEVHGDRQRKFFESGPEGIPARVDVGFAVIQSAALQGADESEAYRTVEQLLREGYIKAANLMEPNERTT